MAKQFKELLKAEVQQEEKRDEATASISAVIQKELAKMASAEAMTNTNNIPNGPAITLKSILKNAKNASSTN